MLKIGQNGGKIANYPPQCWTKICTTASSIPFWKLRLFSLSIFNIFTWLKIFSFKVLLNFGNKEKSHGAMSNTKQCLEKEYHAFFDRKSLDDMGIGQQKWSKFLFFAKWTHILLPVIELFTAHSKRLDSKGRLQRLQNEHERCRGESEKQENAAEWAWALSWGNWSSFAAHMSDRFLHIASQRWLSILS